MKNTLIQLLTFFLVIFNTSVSISADNYSNYSSRNLYIKSWESQNLEEQIRIRAYLAENFSQTAEGLLSKALLAYDNDDKEARDYFKKSIIADPKFYHAGWEYSRKYSLDKDVAVKILEKILRENFKFNHGFALWNLANKLKRFDAPWDGFNGFLLKWEEALGGEYYIFDYMRAFYYESKGNNAEALKYYNSSLNKEGGNQSFDLWQDLLIFKCGRMSHSYEDRVKHITQMEKLAEQLFDPVDGNYSLYKFRVYHEIAHVYQKSKSLQKAIEYYVRSLSYFFEPSVILKVSNIYKDNDQIEGAKQALEFGIERNSESPSLLREYAKYAITDGDYAKASDLYERSINHSYLKKNKRKISLEYCYSLLMKTYNFNKAKQILVPFYNDDNKDKESNKDIFETLAFINLLSGDYDLADDYFSRKNMGESRFGSFLNKRNQIDEFIKRKKMQEEYNQTNEFEIKWIGKNGESARVSLNFASNSATILKSDYNKLATIAKLVSGDGAENYGFRIEGHTDSSGSDAINDPLSLERATAVVSHLKKKYDISHYRLEAKGFGSRNPIISNSTKEGRSRNRRVEILLTKNLKNPTISVTTIPNTELMAVTPDKKFFIARGVRGAFNFWRIDDFVRLKTYKDFMPSGDHFTERIRPQFSPTGRYIAYAHSFKAFGSALVVFDSFSGRIVNQVALPDRIVEFAWSPFGDEIAIYLVGQLVKYRLDEKKVTSFKTLVENRGRRGLVWTDDGRYLALIQKGGVRIFDAQTLDDFDDLSVDFPHSLGLTHNGNYLICADNDRKLHVWDIRNNFKHRSMKIPVLGGRITSHPNKNKVLVNDWGGENKNQVILVDVNKMIIEAQSMVGDSNLYYEFIANGNQILQANHHTNIINVLNVKNLGVEKSFNGESNDAKGCIAFSDQGLLVTWDTEGFHIWDIATGKKIHVWKGTFEAFRDLSTLTKQGQFLALDKSSEDKATNVILFDVGTFARKVLLTLDFEVDLWGIDKGHLLFAGTPFMPLSEGSSKGIVQRYDLKSGALKGTIEVDMITEPLNSDSISMSAFSAITLSPDGDLVAVRTSWIDGWKTKRKYSQSTQVYSFKKGNKISQIDSVHEHLFFDSENRVCLSEKAFNPRNGSYLGKAGADISAVFWPFTTMNTEGKFLSRNLFVEVGKDNQVNLKNNTTKQLVLTIAVKRNNEWIAYAPSGEYVSSLNGTNKVYWLLGDKTLPFNAFKDKYDSPHIVKLKLEEISTNKKRIIKVTPKIDPEIFSSPYSVKLISQNNIEIQSGSYTLKLAVTKENANIPDPEFEYSLNGRVLKKSRGFDIVPVEKGPKTVKVEHLFELQGGLNIIEANIVYKGTNIHPQKVLITKTIENKLANNVQLWFFGVGVSTYEKTQQNLEFAHKDATKLGALLKAQEGKLFQKVNVLTMVNSEATEKNVRINMQRFLKKASSQDVIVIFLAGHGVQDNEQNLYFMTHDGTLDEPYTGMDLSKFESYLKSRPINQKVILMMDICHAGSMGLNGSRRGAITAEDAIKQLSEGTGTIVFASSTGKESSLEDVSYGGGHGAFTAALIEGLTGDADKKSGDQNNYVGILELMSYVSRRVPEITNGDQHPTTPQLINVRDFPLAEL